MTEKDDSNQHLTVTEERNISKLLTKLGMAAICVTPLIAYSIFRGYCENQGVYPLGNLASDSALTYILAMPAIGGIGQIIPLRFDNMDPGCFSTIAALPITTALAAASYSLGSFLAH